MADIRLRVSYEDLEGEHDEALRSLAEEVAFVPGAHAKPDDAGPRPDGARGLDAGSIETLLITIPAGITAVQSLLSVLRSWQRRRGASGRSSGGLKVRLGDDVLELEAADEATTARVVEAWLAAHPAGE
ncbi:MAG: hypothetical protein GEV11_00770 [Streptosporangiales bacterium]|nr:hypothetical protein [Streptosporangiales bacterium]